MATKKKSTKRPLASGPKNVSKLKGGLKEYWKKKKAAQNK